MEPTEETLWNIFEGIRFRASKRKRVNLQAALFCDLSEEDQILWFNERVLPVWREADCPEPFKDGFLEFQLRFFVD